MVRVSIHDVPEPLNINLGYKPNRFNVTTVADLREKINTLYPEHKNTLSCFLFTYNDDILSEEKNLAFYNINDYSLIMTQKGYIPNKNYGLKFVRKADAITGENDNQIRVQLSCGHAVDPTSLTAWCRSLMYDGKFEFYCPAIINDNYGQCKAMWSFKEVRKVALLTQSEIEYFEEKLNQNAASFWIDFKECPKCKTYVERLDKNNLRVRCTICQQKYRKIFDFCWQCSREWTVPVRSAHDTCGRQGCEHDELKTLKDCHLINLASVRDLPQIPSIRACPTCGKLLEHNGSDCKNIMCNRCNVEFCFACLKTTQECQRLKPGSHFSTCASPVAEKQTRIPIWKEKTTPTNFESQFNNQSNLIEYVSPPPLPLLPHRNRIVTPAHRNRLRNRSPS